jgi:hypothetical protein
MEEGTGREVLMILCKRLMSIRVSINLIKSKAMESSTGLQAAIIKVAIKMMREMA